MNQAQTEILNQDFELGFTYTRSTGPVVGHFLTELRERRIVGVKTSDGRVIVPPMEFDPVTTAPLNQFVEVGDTGVITTWSWNPNPRPAQPLQKPFAWALIQLEGADVPMLHAVAADSSDNITTGSTVKVKWAKKTIGMITDIAYFELL